MLMHCFPKLTKISVGCQYKELYYLQVPKCCLHYKLSHLCHINSFRSQEKHLANAKGNISQFNTLVYSIVA